MANAGTYGSSGSGGTASAPAGSGGSFPSGISPTQLIEALGVNSTDVGLYVTNGQLNQRGEELLAYHNATEQDRQSIQQAMVQAGLLKTSDANGVVGGTAETAYKQLINEASAQGQSVQGYLNQVGQGGLGTIENQIASNVAGAEATLGKTTPIVATETNPTTLAAAINQAVDQTLGYTPGNMDQITQAFISQIQGQDVAYAESGQQANRAAAQETIDRAKAEDSALSKLGPDGIDTFLSAYVNAIHGTGVAGAGTVQGPATGSQPNANYLKPGTKLGPDTNVGFNTSGNEMLSNTLPTMTTRSSPAVSVPAPSQITLPFTGTPITPPGSGMTIPAHSVTTGSPTPGNASVAPALPPGLPGATSTYGGLYALTPALWQDAQKLYPGAKKYATAGTAPQSVQQAAVTALATNLYEQSGSWADVATTLAGGKPGASGKVLGSSTNINTFANDVANQVNDQIAALQTEVNTAPDVTIKTTQPDVAAEANLAAKQSDPVGYYAANAASFGGLLGKMLFGRPLDIVQSTADTFTGPVESTASPTSTGAAA